jgi:hypothetical protein
MSAPWHKKDPSQLSRLKEDLEKKYSDLYLTVEGDLVYLRGTIPILHGGAELDRFQVEVIILPEFPKQIPMIRETGDRIPNTAYWHTYAQGALCIIVPEDWLMDANYTSITAFLDGPVRNYFISHAIAECNVTRPMGERQHDSKGLYEAYGEMVGSSQPAVIEKYLEYLTKKKIKGHWKCPCGSGKRLRDCHRADIVNLQKKIPRWVAESALKRLYDQIQRERL